MVFFIELINLRAFHVSSYNAPLQPERPFNRKKGFQ